MKDDVKDVTYRLVDFGTLPRQDEPFLGKSPAWIVYAGDVGDIFVYKPNEKMYKWERLGQNYSDNGYWRVSIADAARARPWSYYVHQLILLGWEGPAPEDKYVGCHKSGDKNDNRPANLRWGSDADNARDTVEQKSFRDSKRAMMVGMELRFICEKDRWRCEVKHPNRHTDSKDGISPDYLLAWAFKPRRLAWYRKTEVDINTKGKILPHGATLLADTEFKRINGLNVPSSFEFARGFRT